VTLPQPTDVGSEVYPRAIVNIQNRSTDAPAQNTVHTVWHHNISFSTSDFDYQGHCDNIANCFLHGTNGSSHFFLYTSRKIHVKVYEMQDLKPRPVRGETILTPTSWDTTAIAPREIAVPMRYYAGRNIKGKRGRLFIGPWDMSQIAETVDPLFQTSLCDLATALGAVGGANTSWVLHHPSLDVLDAPGSPGGTTPAAYSDITAAWVSDLWAHMESREQPEGHRTTVSITPGIP